MMLILMFCFVALIFSVRLMFSPDLVILFSSYFDNHLAVEEKVIFFHLFMRLYLSVCKSLLLFES